MRPDDGVLTAETAECGQPYLMPSGNQYKPMYLVDRTVCAAYVIPLEANIGEIKTKKGETKTVERHRKVTGISPNTIIYALREELTDSQAKYMAAIRKKEADDAETKRAPRKKIPVRQPDPLPKGNPGKTRIRRRKGS